MPLTQPAGASAAPIVAVVGQLCDNQAACNKLQGVILYTHRNRLDPLA